MPNGRRGRPAQPCQQTKLKDNQQLADALSLGKKKMGHGAGLVKVGFPLLCVKFAKSESDTIFMVSSFYYSRESS
jgi:hypothetical protein